MTTTAREIGYPRAMQDRAGQAGRAVPIAEAAARLGLRPETLRKQLARGRAPGLKRGGQWFAVLDDVLDVQDGVQDHAGHDAGQQTEPVQHSDPDVPPMLDSVQDGAGPSALDVALAEVAFLRTEISALQERLREAHVLLAQERALPAPRVDQEQLSQPAIVARPWYARWLAWWRR